MWHGGDGGSRLEALRHECSEGDGLGPYGWGEHDGRSYGKQDIEDRKAGVRLVTSMVKPAQLNQQDTGLAVDGSAADGGFVQVDGLSLETSFSSDSVIESPMVLTKLVSLSRVRKLILFCRRCSEVTCRAISLAVACFTHVLRGTHTQREAH